MCERRSETVNLDVKLYKLLLLSFVRTAKKLKLNIIGKKKMIVPTMH